LRAVLDPNILIAALLSPGGGPAQVVARWLAGDFELVISPSLLAELDRALAYPKLRSRIEREEAAEFIELLKGAALVAPDPPDAAPRSADPDDDYLPALAESENSVLLTGDRHLLALADELPIRTARAFLELLEQAD
jgi:uncharacterized protein